MTRTRGTQPGVDTFAAELADMRARIAALERHTAARYPAVPWTPVVTQGVPVATAVSIGSYSIQGDWVIASFSLICTSGGTPGAAVVVDLPVPAAVLSGNIGVGAIYDNSTATRYPAIMDMISGGTQMWFGDSTTAGTTWALGTWQFTAGLALPDFIGATVQYRWT